MAPLYRHKFLPIVLLISGFLSALIAYQASDQGGQNNIIQPALSGIIAISLSLMSVGLSWLIPGTILMSLEGFRSGMRNSSNCCVQNSALAVYFYSMRPSSSNILSDC